MLDRMQCGEVPHKHHTALYSQGSSSKGRLRYEECITRGGFDGPYTIAYHEHRPHEQRLIRVLSGVEPPTASGEPAFKRRHFSSQQLDAGPGSPLERRVPLLFNEDLTLSSVRPTTSDTSYFCNADADDLYFILEGSGTLRSALGDLRFEPMDYVVVPRGIPSRFVLDAEGEHVWLNIALCQGLGLPRHMRNPVGQLRMDAPFCHRDFRRPEFRGPIDEGIREIVIRRGGRLHAFEATLPPLDVVGWDGSVYPFAFPIFNFQPRVGSVHLPPTVHANFEARGALVCSFVPRPLDFHPKAIPCPYPHTSVDMDEVIYYCAGDFASRRGVRPGSLSWHPAGLPHGPHPGKYEASLGQKATDEVAVMLDCTRPLQATAHAQSVEDAAYHESFIEA